MRLNELRAATSFRLALFFVAVFGSASLVFAATVYTMTSRFLSGNPDERMRAQAASYDSQSRAQAEKQLDQHSEADLAGRRPFGLFDAQGHWLAGNLKALPHPLPPLEQFFETQVEQQRTVYRSILHRLPNGNLIVVSRNIEELQRFRNEFLEATMLGLGLMLLLGIGGGVAIGVGSIRRLDRVIRAIEGITRGDLSGRLPSRGTNDDIDRLVRVVNSMLDQIERLMGEVKGVCDSIAHDLRTPLTRLLGALERANRRNLPAAERSAGITTAISEVQMMLRTFAALLRISEIEDGARRASFRAVDLADVANDAVEYYEPAAEARDIALTFESKLLEADETAVIQGDADLLFEALGNLIDNAIKFTPYGGRIAVELIPGPALSVRDTGCGISAADRESVMLRFHRGNRAQDTAGSGLGLPLVAAIARLHGMAVSIPATRSGCRIVMAPAFVQPRSRRLNRDNVEVPEALSNENKIKELS